MQNKHWLALSTPIKQSLSLIPGGPYHHRHDVRLPFPRSFVSPLFPNSTNTFFGIALVAFEYDRIEAVEFPGRAAIFRQLETLHADAESISAQTGICGFRCWNITSRTHTISNEFILDDIRLKYRNDASRIARMSLIDEKGEKLANKQDLAGYIQRSSVAALAIAPLRHLLNLGAEARMNLLGSMEGN